MTLGNLFRDQLDRYGELELVAERWRAMVAALPPETTLVVNADDAVVADLADGRPAAIRFGLDDPTHARPRLQHAADSKYCLRCGHPYDFAAAYRRTPRRLPVPELRSRSAAARSRGAGHRASRASCLALPDLTRLAARLRSSSPCPGSTTCTTPRPRQRWRSRVGASLEDVRSGLARFSAAFGRFERIPAGGKSVVLLLIKNPAGANEVVRTLETGVPPVLVVALNDAIADGQDVSWIWDVDFEPLLEHAGLVIASGSARPSWV